MPPRNIAVVVGAGASLAQSDSFRPHRNRLRPPLDATFFARAKALDVPLTSDLVKYSLSSGLGNPLEQPHPSMEQFFGELYFDLINNGDNDDQILKAYRSLLRVYTRLLAETTNWMSTRTGGSLSHFVRNLIAQSPESITFITFNQDLVLENVLNNLPLHRRWCIGEGYGDIDLTFGSTSGSTLFPFHDNSLCNHSTDIKVLKLHGSLNWQQRTRSHDPSFADLFHTSNRKTIDGVLNTKISLTLQQNRGTRSWRMWPIIVPPI